MIEGRGVKGESGNPPWISICLGRHCFELLEVNCFHATVANIQTLNLSIAAVPKGDHSKSHPNSTARIPFHAWVVVGRKQADGLPFSHADVQLAMVDPERVCRLQLITFVFSNEFAQFVDAGRRRGVITISVETTQSGSRGIMDDHRASIPRFKLRLLDWTAHPPCTSDNHKPT